MNDKTLYDALEKLAREVVSVGFRQNEILQKIAHYRTARPDYPPAKGLLAEITEASSKELFTAEHRSLIREIGFYFV